MKQSELFDHLVYLSEVCDVLAIAMAELPNLLSPSEVAEALLRLKYGPYIICHIVANQPDCFSEGNISTHCSICINHFSLTTNVEQDFL